MWVVAVVLDNRVLRFILSLRSKVTLSNPFNFSELKFYFYKVRIITHLIYPTE